jgi:uncharacterized protein with HEPN domain
MSPEEKLRLTHIAEAAALIARYVEGISKREFLEDTLRQDAVIRRIQIIGEAVRLCHTSFCPRCLIFRQRRRGECATFWFTIMTA